MINSNISPSGIIAQPQSTSPSFTLRCSIYRERKNVWVSICGIVEVITTFIGKKFQMRWSLCVDFICFAFSETKLYKSASDIDSNYFGIQLAQRRGLVCSGTHWGQDHTHKKDAVDRTVSLEGVGKRHRPLRSNGVACDPTQRRQLNFFAVGKWMTKFNKCKQGDICWSWSKYLGDDKTIIGIIRGCIYFLSISMTTHSNTSKILPTLFAELPARESQHYFPVHPILENSPGIILVNEFNADSKIIVKEIMSCEDSVWCGFLWYSGVQVRCELKWYFDRSEKRESLILARSMVWTVRLVLRASTNAFAPWHLMPLPKNSACEQKHSCPSVQSLRMGAFSVGLSLAAGKNEEVKNMKRHIRVSEWDLTPPLEKKITRALLCGPSFAKRGGSAIRSVIWSDSFEKSHRTLLVASVVSLRVASEPQVMTSRIDTFVSSKGWMTGWLGSISLFETSLESW